MKLDPETSGRILDEEAMNWPPCPAFDEAARAAARAAGLSDVEIDDILGPSKVTS
jgi:hypothetical protein